MAAFNIRWAVKSSAYRMNIGAQPRCTLVDPEDTKDFAGPLSAGVFGLLKIARRDSPPDGRPFSVSFDRQIEKFVRKSAPFSHTNETK
jgi:hypothetical protein